MPGKSVSLCLVAAAFLAATVSCGHARFHRPSEPSGAVSSSSASQASASRITLSDALAQIDSAPPPAGVSVDRWAGLTAALKRLLVARASGGKTPSTAPTWSGDAVTDLTAISNAAGTQATLSWTEALPGDYNNDGVVDIIDLQPMALYYGQWTDSGPFDGHRLVVGDSDPQIGIGDLQAIANNYAAHLQGYEVWRGHWNGTSSDWETTPRPNPNPANPSWSADRPSPPPVSTRPSYTFTDDLSAVTDKANVRYKVTAFGDGSAGAESSQATLLPYPLANSPWPKFRGNMQNTGQSPYVGPQTNHVRWTFLTGAYIDTASPSLGADGSVYIASTDGYLYALNPADGTMKWKALTGGWSSTPAVAADATIYVGGADGKIHAISPLDGSFRWQVTLTSTSVESSPAIGADGTIYVGCDTSLGGTDMFFALNPGDGSFKWKRPLGGSVRSSPAVGPDGTIYVGSDDHNVYALNPADGSTKWFHTTGDMVISSPAVGSDGTIYVGSADKYVYALNPSDGSSKWKTQTGDLVTSSPAVGNDGTVYVGSFDHNVYAFNPNDGSVKWSLPTGFEVLSSPSVDASSTIYVGSEDTYIYALSDADGSPLWSYHAGDIIDSSPAVGVDGSVYVGSYKACVYAFGY